MWFNIDINSENQYPLVREWESTSLDLVVNKIYCHFSWICWCVTLLVAILADPVDVYSYQLYMQAFDSKGFLIAVNCKPIWMHLGKHVIWKSFSSILFHPSYFLFFHLFCIYMFFFSCFFYFFSLVKAFHGAHLI